MEEILYSELDLSKCIICANTKGGSKNLSLATNRGVQKLKDVTPRRRELNCADFTNAVTTLEKLFLSSDELPPIYYHLNPCYSMYTNENMIKRLAKKRLKEENETVQKPDDLASIAEHRKETLRASGKFLYHL